MTSARNRMRGRFAPSPTGAMHLGNARTALLAWLDSRSAGGEVVLRLEDLDAARAHPKTAAALLDDLKWLGLDWDEGPDEPGHQAGSTPGPYGPYRQTERTHLYDAAIDRLLAAEDAYLCACSRADVARAVSAPHGEDGPRYPGTCRVLSPDEVRARAAATGRQPAVRFRAPAPLPDDSHGFESFDDRIHGRVRPLANVGIDDFVIRRADGVAAYQLAVVIDDAAMAITDVVRGDDLLASTPRQLAVYQALGLPAPRFAHVSLVLSPGGERLAKRTRPASIADLRGRGVPPKVVVGAIAASAGLVPVGSALLPRDLVDGFRLADVTRGPIVLDAASLGIDRCD
jgi:glutamyl-tRNA synthetase